MDYNATDIKCKEQKKDIVLQGITYLAESIYDLKYTVNDLISNTAECEITGKVDAQGKTLNLKEIVDASPILIQEAAKELSEINMRLRESLC